MMLCDINAQSLGSWSLITKPTEHKCKSCGTDHRQSAYFSLAFTLVLQTYQSIVCDPPVGSLLGTG